jgi:hypothetical protein
MADVTNYTIENASGANVRIDLNNVFAAIQSSNSKSSDLAVSQCVAGMPFLNTTTNILKIRNSSNGAFTEIGNIDQANLGLLSKAGGTMTGPLLIDNSNSASTPALSFDGDTDLGLFRKSANIMGFSSSGAEQMVFDANGITLRQQNEIRFGDNDSSNYVAFKSHATVGTSYTLTLPSGQGANGTVLQNDGSGNLSFQPGTVVVGSTTINVGTGSASTIAGLTSLTAATLNSTTHNTTDVKATNVKDASGGNSTTPLQINRGRAKFWVNFNGTGTLAVRDSFNVSSVTDGGTGRYTVNFSTSFDANDNYCVATCIGQSNSNGDHGHLYLMDGFEGGGDLVLAGSVTVEVHRLNSSVAMIDKKHVCIVGFGDQ